MIPRAVLGSLAFALPVLGWCGGVPNGIYTLDVAGTQIESVIVHGEMIDDDRLLDLGLPAQLSVAGMPATLTGDVLRIEPGLTSFRAQQLYARRQRTLAAPDRASALMYPIVNYNLGIDKQVSMRFGGDIEMIKPLSESWSAGGRLVAPMGGTPYASATLEHRDEATHTLTLIGNTYSSTAGMSSPRRLFGLSLRKDTTLFQPGFVLAPELAISGTAKAPSSIEVFVNGTKTYAGRINPGQFELAGLQSLNANGDVVAVFRDAAGKETVQTYQLPGADGLLKAGYSTWGIDAGKLQTGNNTYGDVFGSAFYRRGITDRWTIGGALTAQPGEITGYLNTSLGTPLGGLSATVSSRQQSILGYTARFGSMWARVRKVIESESSMLSASIGSSWHSGAWALAAAQTESEKRITASLSYKWLGVSVSRVSKPSGDATEFFASVNIPLGSAAGLPGSSLFASVYETPQASTQRVALTSFGEALSVSAAAEAESRKDGRKQYSVQGRVQTGSVQTMAYGSVGDAGASWSLFNAGAIVFADRPLFANTIREGYILAETGAPGAAVRLDNRAVATAGDDGQAVMSVPANWEFAVSATSDAIDDDLRPASVPAAAAMRRGVRVALQDPTVGVYVDIPTASTVTDQAGQPLLKTSSGYWLEAAPGTHRLHAGQQTLCVDVTRAVRNQRISPVPCTGQ